MPEKTTKPARKRAPRKTAAVTEPAASSAPASSSTPPVPAEVRDLLARVERAVRQSEQHPSILRSVVMPGDRWAVVAEWLHTHLG